MNKLEELCIRFGWVYKMKPFPGTLHTISHSACGKECWIWQEDDEDEISVWKCDPGWVPGRRIGVVSVDDIVGVVKLALEVGFIISAHERIRVLYEYSREDR